MTVRIVMIHRGPSDTCPCAICHEAMTPEAQGREIEWQEDGTPRGGAMFGLLVAVAILAAAIGIGLIIYGSVS